MQNSLIVLRPRRLAGTWVFSDANTGLVDEPFVQGIPEMITHLVANIPNAKKGFRLFFSKSAFPGYQEKLTWVREDSKGNWYRQESTGAEGWLCPALFHYFDQAPECLFVCAEAINV
jgi:hypothetical protein